MTDALQSVGVVIAGVVIVLTGATIVDPVISIVIGIFITYSGGRIALEAAHVLMESTPKEVSLVALEEAMRSHEGVGAVTDLHVWTLTTGYNAMSAHVVSEEGLSAADRESLRDCLSEMVEHAFEVHHVTLQVEESCRACEVHDCSSWMRCREEDES